MLQGKQIGTLMLDDINGIKVIIDEYSVRFQRIVNGVADDYVGLAMYKDIYCNRQGNMVGGIVLCDANGYPIDNEHYKVSDFTWSGNISYGGGEVISFL